MFAYELEDRFSEEHWMEEIGKRGYREIEGDGGVKKTVASQWFCAMMGELPEVAFKQIIEVRADTSA